MSIYRRPHLIENPVPDPEPRLADARDPYHLNENPLRKVVGIERRDNGWEGVLRREAWVEVLECGHDGRATWAPAEDESLLPRAKRRRCFWCTERGQQAVRRREGR